MHKNVRRYDTMFVSLLVALLAIVVGVVAVKYGIAAIVAGIATLLTCIGFKRE